MEERSVWSTWKPWAIIGALVLGGIWWWNSQSPFAQLKDGPYDCVAVYVNESGKYEVLVDSAGAASRSTARVEEGKLVELCGDGSLSSSQLASLTMRSSGTTEFHVTDDPATKMYDAVACKYAG